MELLKQSTTTTRETLDLINSNLKKDIQDILDVYLKIENKGMDYLSLQEILIDFDIVKDIESRILKAIKRKNTRLYAENLQKKKIEDENIPAVDYEIMKTMFLNRFYLQNDVHFRVDDFNRKEFNLLLHYFMNDPEFEKEGRSLKKGLCLIGSYGCGKTSMMKAFQNNPKQHYITMYVPKIFDAYKSAKDSDKQSVINQYTEPSKIPNIPDNYFRHEKSGICFDDPLKEINANNFGETRNIFREITLARYDQKSSFKGLTHMTTNALMPQLTEKYGGDFVDRMKEMFNIIVFPNQESRRG